MYNRENISRDNPNINWKTRPKFINNNERIFNTPKFNQIKQKNFGNYDRRSSSHLPKMANSHKESNIINIPGFFVTSRVNKNSFIGVESFLKHPPIQNKVKSDYICKPDGCNTSGCKKTGSSCNCLPYRSNGYTNFGMPGRSRNGYTYMLKDDFSSVCYEPIGNKSAGRGFGQFDASQWLRYPRETRSDRGNISSFEFYTFDKNNTRFEQLTRSSYQNPKHLVLPWARGGIDTRNLDRYTKYY